MSKGPFSTNVISECHTRQLADGTRRRVSARYMLMQHRPNSPRGRQFARPPLPLPLRPPRLPIPQFLFLHWDRVRRLATSTGPAALHFKIHAMRLQCVRFLHLDCTAFLAARWRRASCAALHSRRAGAGQRRGERLGRGVVPAPRRPVSVGTTLACFLAHCIWLFESRLLIFGWQPHGTVRQSGLGDQLLPCPLPPNLRWFDSVECNSRGARRSVRSGAVFVTGWLDPRRERPAQSISCATAETPACVPRFSLVSCRSPAPCRHARADHTSARAQSSCGLCRTRLQRASTTPPRIASQPRERLQTNRRFWSRRTHGRAKHRGEGVVHTPVGWVITDRRSSRNGSQGSNKRVMRAYCLRSMQGGRSDRRD